MYVKLHLVYASTYAAWLATVLNAIEWAGAPIRAFRTWLFVKLGGNQNPIKLGWLLPRVIDCRPGFANSVIVCSHFADVAKMIGLPLKYVEPFVNYLDGRGLYVLSSGYNTHRPTNTIELYELFIDCFLVGPAQARAKDRLLEMLKTIGNLPLDLRYCRTK